MVAFQFYRDEEKKGYIRKPVFNFEPPARRSKFYTLIVNDISIADFIKYTETDYLKYKEQLNGDISGVNYYVNKSMLPSKARDQLNTYGYCTINKIQMGRVIEDSPREVTDGA